MICKTCSRDLPEKDFPVRSDTYTRRKNCRSCESAARMKRPYKAKTREQLDRHNEYTKNISKKKRRDPALVPFHIWKDSKKHDKKKGHDHDLTVEFIANRIKDGCIHCGETTIRMTMDRIDNSIGHIQSNVEPVCYRCNMIRREMPYDAFLCIAPAIKQAREQGLFGGWIGGIKGTLEQSSRVLVRINKSVIGDP